VMPLAKLTQYSRRVADQIIYSFACGCLLGAAGFLMFPEGNLLIAGGSSSESEGSSTFGLSLLAGFLVGGIIHWASEAFTNMSAQPDNAKVSPEKELESQEVTEGDTDGPTTMLPQDKALVLSVLWGDFFHNFVDGIAIGVAFTACDAAMGWTVAAGAVAHEFSQEVADFMMITKAGVKPLKAVLLNFLSGLSCVIGGLISAYSEFSTVAKGAVLVFGGGTYLWIAAAEEIPKLPHAKSKSDLLIRIVSFCVGGLLIGLVLLGHEHCEAGHGHGDHHDH